MAVWEGQGIVPVRTAVVGLGYWGPNLVRNLQELPDAELVTVCDLREDALQKIGLRYPSVTTTTDFADVLADERIEAVLIATPVSTHFSLASAALRSGKHVFVEKPLAVSSAEVVALIDLADELGRVLMPGHTFLYSPPVNTIRELISSGELGDIYFISTSRVNLGLHQSDVSVAWDLGPHDFSILRYWLEETPTHVTALSRGCVIPDIPTSPSSTWSSDRRRSLTSSSHGLLRASSAGRRSSAPRRWLSTTTSARSRYGSSTLA